MEFVVILLFYFGHEWVLYNLKFTNVSDENETSIFSETLPISLNRNSLQNVIAQIWLTNYIKCMQVESQSNCNGLSNF